MVLRSLLRWIYVASFSCNQVLYFQSALFELLLATASLRERIYWTGLWNSWWTDILICHLISLHKGLQCALAINLITDRIVVKSLEISVLLLLTLFGTLEVNFKSCEYKNIHFFISKCFIVFKFFIQILIFTNQTFQPFSWVNETKVSAV